MGSARSAAALVCLLATNGCSHAEEEPDGGSPLLPGSTGEGGTSPFDESGATECSEENTKIYVFGADNALFRFDPQNLSFTRIGILSCPTATSPFSMAVTRRGTAWVEYTDGRLYRASTQTARCEATAFVPGQPGFSDFGMGYASNGGQEFENDAGSAGDAREAGDGGDGGGMHGSRADGGGDAGREDAGMPGANDGDAGGAGTDGGATEAETLYLSGQALGWLDTTSLELHFVSSLSLGRTELSGTGNGLLYAYSIESGVVSRLNQRSGALEKQYRTTAVDSTGSSAFAFAHWGGDFFIFTATGDRSLRDSKVTRYSPSTDTSEVVIERTGMVVVGAGSSTCAPTSSSLR